MDYDMNKNFAILSALNSLAGNKIPEFKRLVNVGFSVDEDLSGSRPIHEICRYGYEDFLKYLISMDADINALDWDNRTPIMICIEFDRWNCFKILVDNGASFGMEIAQWIRNYDKEELGIHKYIMHLIHKVYWDRRKGMVFALAMGKVNLQQNIARELVKFL
jgi:hypothetical protein